MSSDKSSKTVPALPLSNVLNDLAIIRAASVPPLAPVVDQRHSSSDRIPDSVHASVQSSYDFTQQGRAALKLHSSESVNNRYQKLQDLKCRVDAFVDGLDRD